MSHHLAIAIALLLPLGCSKSQSETARPPAFGKTDGGDTADRNCKVILRQLDGLQDGFLDVDLAIADNGGQPAILYTFDKQNYLQTIALEKQGGGVAGYAARRLQHISSSM